MHITGDLREGIFLSRPNRFIVLCSLDGAKVKAYLPNPGRLRELLLPGSVIYLTKQTGEGRKTNYLAVAVLKEGEPVFLHTHANNDVARFLIERNKIPGLEGSEIVRSEVTEGRSRFDFLLRKGEEELLLEVKSCTLFHGSIAMFPDAVTERGRRHIMELATLSKDGRKGAVLFLVHSSSARYFLPDYHTDIKFSRMLLRVRTDIMVKAVSVEWRKDLSGLRRVRELSVPWDQIERECDDRGTYILVMKLARDRRIQVGNLGRILFRKGHYLYVGSAKRSLAKRIERHCRKRKKFFWHIDYLREHAELREALAVRSKEHLECDIACAVRKLCGWSVPGFGSSDCRCDGHLFGMSDDPLTSRTFVNSLLYFRMGRIEKELDGTLR